MTKFYSFILILLVTVSGTVNGQNLPKPVAVNANSLELKKGNDGNNVKPQAINLLEEDFAYGIPNDWTINDSSGICPWKYTFQGSSGYYNGNFPGPGIPMNSPTAYNGYIISDIDSANYHNYGIPYNAKYQNLKTEIITPSFDASAHAEVFLEFHQYFRYSENQELYVSVSNDSVNWTDFIVTGSTGNGTPSANTDSVNLDISSVAGNESQVWVKFWWNARIFFWMLDDIRVYPKPNNDLAFGPLEYYRTVLDTNWKWFYTEIPQKQAPTANIHFGADVTNRGVVDQTNTELQIKISGGDNWTGTGNPITVPVNDTVPTQLTAYNPFNVGTYNVEWSLSSDSIEDIPIDNVKHTSFEVTDTVYAWDVDDYGGNGFWYNANSALGVCNRFEIGATDTVSSVSVLFQGNTTSGAQVNILLMNNAFGVMAQQTYTLTSAEIGNWATFDLPDTEVVPGLYHVGFQQLTSTNNNVLMGFSDSQPPMPAGKAFARSNNFGTWFPFQSQFWMPMIRMNMKANQCTGIKGTFTSDYVSCSSNDGSASVSVSGGTPPYSYAWSNSSTTSTINSLSPGTYTVTVTDDNGCSVIYPYTIDNPPPTDITQIEQIPTCAGDCDGEITLTPSGQGPFTYQWNSNAGNQTTVTATGLCAFLYQVTVTDSYNCTAVGIVDLEEPDTIKYNTTFTEDNGPGDGTATVDVTSGGVPPFDYEWSDGQTTATATGLFVGTYTVTITDANGCTSEETIVVTDVDEYSQTPTEINVYPNPSKGVFEIRFKNAVLDEYEITITNMVGKTIIAEKARLYGNNTLLYNLSEYSKGVYFISVANQTENNTQKIVIQ